MSEERNTWRQPTNWFLAVPFFREQRMALNRKILTTVLGVDLRFIRLPGGPSTGRLGHAVVELAFSSFDRGLGMQ